jgi:hypothetical protein
VLTSGRDGRRWPDSSRRREDNGDVLSSGSCQGNAPKAPGDRDGVQGWHNRQHGRRVLGTWCQEFGCQVVEAAPHEDEQSQQGRSGRSSLLASTVQKTTQIDWQSFGLRNKMLNGKTERKRRDERDSVLTFGQG